MTQTYFLGIGAAKSGTSWLSEYLRRHPDVAMSPIKELHYFDARFCPELSGHWDADWLRIKSELEAKIAAQSTTELNEKLRCVTLRLEMIADPLKYRRYFEEIVQPEHRAFGEITPAYSMLPAEGFSAILGLYPQAKFVFLMRDPVERYCSHIRFMQKMRSVQGNAPGESFDADREAQDNLLNVHFMKRADYKATIETLSSTADESQLCVLFYEHLFDETQNGTELHRLCAFLGIQHTPGNIQARVNASDAFQFDEGVRRRIRDHFSAIYDFVHQKYGGRVPSAWL
jgi:hypothetical protein